MKVLRDGENLNKRDGRRKFLDRGRGMNKRIRYSLFILVKECGIFRGRVGLEIMLVVWVINILRWILDFYLVGNRSFRRFGSRVRVGLKLYLRNGFWILLF